MNKENNIVEELKSLDLLWNQVYQQLDVWSERASQREENLVNSVTHLVENVKRNQQNAKELIQQFTKEQREWEKNARNQLFSYTTVLSVLIPKISYVDINQNFEQFHNKVMELSEQPVEKLSRPEFLENLIQTTEKYVEFRYNSREKLVESIKRKAKVIHNSQEKVIRSLSKYMKNVLFPINRFIDPLSKVSAARDEI